MRTPRGRWRRGSRSRSAHNAEIRGNRPGSAGVQSHMGIAGAARVDTAAVRAIAREYETVAAILDATVRTHLSGLGFGGATAGRAHVAHGDALRGKLFDVITGLRQWSRAAEEIAAALQGSVERYQSGDAAAADRVGRP